MEAKVEANGTKIIQDLNNDNYSIPELSILPFHTFCLVFRAHLIPQI